MPACMTTQQETFGWILADQWSAHQDESYLSLALIIQILFNLTPPLSSVPGMALQTSSKECSFYPILVNIWPSWNPCYTPALLHLASSELASVRSRRRPSENKRSPHDWLKSILAQGVLLVSFQCKSSFPYSHTKTTDSADAHMLATIWDTQVHMISWRPLDKECKPQNILDPAFLPSRHPFSCFLGIVK